MVTGKTLMLSLDCKSCHKEAEKSIGPAFLQVAQKYSQDPHAATYLSQKIIKGGSGVWGEVPMAAHPTLPQADVDQIVTWILSLGNKAVVKKSLPASGVIIPPANAKPTSALVLTASYTDKGGNNIKALTGTSSIAIPGSSLVFSGHEEVHGFTPFNYNEIHGLVYPRGPGSFLTDAVDLTGVGAINMVTAWQILPASGFGFDVRLDGADGKLLGTGKIPAPKKGQNMGNIHVPITPVSDGGKHKLFFSYKPDPKPDQAYLINVQFAQK